VSYRLSLLLFHVIQNNRSLNFRP